MELVFRKLPLAESIKAQPGEIYLLPAAPDQRQRRDVAKFVLEKRADALMRGPGTPLRIVIDSDPKPDDMLAALFVQFQLREETLPPGCRLFAEYTGRLREGQRPTNLPLEDSLEGIFLAIRGKAEKSLSDPETARQFVADWDRIAAVILTAAREGTDPFRSPLFGTGPGTGGTAANPLRTLNRGIHSTTMGTGFLREQGFLAKDLDVYRQDFTQGEQWIVRLPGGPATSQGLLLRMPKSLLFKYWTRSPCPPPMGGPYQFLAVTTGGGQWVISIDPALHISLQPLAVALQNAERSQNPARADQYAWFDGKSFDYTVVSSPHGGTQLPEKKVLRIVANWSRARSVDGHRKLLRRGIVGGCIAAAVVLAFVFGKLLLDRPATTAANSGAKVVKPNVVLDFHDLYVLSVGVSDYQNIDKLTTPAKDAEAVVAAFDKMQGGLWTRVSTKALTNEQATREWIINYGLNTWLLNQKTTKHSLVIVTFSGHGFIQKGTKRYHFAPQDYKPDSEGTTGIFLPDMMGYLARLPCPAVLVLDTCHSGAIDEGNEEDAWKAVQRLVAASSNNNGLVVIAACSGYQRANETSRWGHGALTLALLEGIEGAVRYNDKDLPRTKLPSPGPKNTVNLQELTRYITDRVEVLSSEMSSAPDRRQAARTYATENISLEQIPIAAYGGK